MSADNDIDARLAAARAMGLSDRMISDVKIIARVPEHRPDNIQNEEIDIIQELLEDGPMPDEP